jgi:hypothetical protein
LDALCDSCQHLLHRDRERGTTGIEHAGSPLLGQADGPFGEVADVDELHRVAPVARRQDLATAGQPHRPISEAIGLVARPDDQRRADDRGDGLAVLGPRFLFAQHLEGAVEPQTAFSDLGRLTYGVVARVDHLIGRLAVGGTDRDRRNEDVLAHGLSARERRRATRPAARSDCRCRGPVAPLKRFEVAVAVAEQLLDRARPRLLLTTARR